MKAAVALLLVVVAMSSVVAGPMRKRFLIEDTTTEYNSAKDTFNSLINGVDFDAAVNALIPLIHSDITVTACVITCVGASASVLGPAAAPFAPTVCTPLCDGALAKLEETAG